MNRTYELQFIRALLLTLALEIPTLLLAARLLLKMDRKTCSLARILGAGFLATFATIPYVWFLLPAFIHNHLLYILVAEGAVFLLEAGIYCGIFKISILRGALLSFLCNGLSYAVGRGLNALG